MTPWCASHGARRGFATDERRRFDTGDAMALSRAPAEGGRSVAEARMHPRSGREDDERADEGGETDEERPGLARRTTP